LQCPRAWWLKYEKSILLQCPGVCEALTIESEMMGFGMRDKSSLLKDVGVSEFNATIV
jgi:hypothetical protein